MQLNRSILVRAALLISLIANLTILSNHTKADTGSCGGATTTLPFTDVMGNPFFCQIAAAYFSGLTAGTSATTYSPADNVNREQMAAFTTRTLDQALKRGSRRAVAKKWWTPQNANSLGLTDVGDVPTQVEFDGTDLWVINRTSDTVSRVRAGDGKLLETWTGATGPVDLLVAFGRIYVLDVSVGVRRILVIDPKQPAGPMTVFATDLAFGPNEIATDGTFIWVACTGVPEQGPSGLCRVDIVSGAVTTFTSGFASPNGVLYDGASLWVSDAPKSLKRVNPDGTIVQLFTLSSLPEATVFDGTNIWVLNPLFNLLTVIRVKDASGAPLTNAFILATLSNNGLNQSEDIAFDGERIMVTNGSANTVSMWKATDLTPLGSFSTGAGTFPRGVCSDGLNFWITLGSVDKLARF